MQRHSARLHSRAANDATARREGSAAENKLRTLTPEGEVDFVKRRRKYYSIATRRFAMTEKFIRFTFGSTYRTIL